MADTLQADIVVVGSGVAGGLVAHQLALAGYPSATPSVEPDVPTKANT